MEKCFPYQIDAVPLQFGSSSITKVTAQFKYQRHYTKLQNIENSPQLGKGQEDLYFGYQTVPKPEAEETKWLLKSIRDQSEQNQNTQMNTHNQ